MVSKHKNSDCGGLRARGVIRENRPGMPLLSIVTAVYNDRFGLEKTARSIRSLSYSNLEWVVIDGGSTDGTVAFLEQSADFIDCFLSAKDRGIYDAMNKGIEKSRGKFIWFVNAGDACINPPDWDFLAAAKPFEVLSFPVVRRLANYQKTIRGAFTGHHQGMIYPARIFADLGFYDTNYRLIADMIFYRAIKHSRHYTVVKKNQPICDFSTTGISSTINGQFQILRDYFRLTVRTRKPLYFLKMLRVATSGHFLRIFFKSLFCRKKSNNDVSKFPKTKNKL